MNRSPRQPVHNLFKTFDSLGYRDRNTPEIGVEAASFQQMPVETVHKSPSYEQAACSKFLEHKCDYIASFG